MNKSECVAYLEELNAANGTSFPAELLYSELLKVTEFIDLSVQYSGNVCQWLDIIYAGFRLGMVAVK